MSRTQSPVARHRLRALAAAAVIVTAATGALAAFASPANAASEAPALSAASILKGFNPGDIISDQVMFNPNAMSRAAIQTFLNGKVPTCRSGYTCLRNYRQTTTTYGADPMCKQYTGAKRETAATIIYRVARACGVNPQVILVTLEKEQGLVTDDWPGAGQYRSATGYGCPDTAACDSDYYGFFNQVYHAAWAFRRYTTPAGTTGPGWTSFNWFPVGKPLGILYNPSTSCGAKTVTIKNKATAVLYYFTPYTPNASALAAGWGEGNGCSAYGNRNFFLYFTSWFGSTHYAVSGVIGTLWHSLGGAKSALGNPTSNARSTARNGGGSYQHFQHGDIVTSPHGTFTITGTTLAEYTAQKGPGGVLGWPKGALSTTAVNGGGTSMWFQGGTIYSSDAGTYAVTGAVYRAYSAAGFQRGVYAWPTGDAVTSTKAGGGIKQSFTGGAFYQSGTKPVIGLTGLMAAAYAARRADAGGYGWPITAETASTENGGGTSVQFQHGGLYNSKAGLFGVISARILSRFTALGGVSGTLGWPTAGAVWSSVSGGGVSQSFTHGTVFATSGTASYEVVGRILTEYTRRGQVASTMGWPTSVRVHYKQNGGGFIETFQSGNIYNSKVGVYAVRLDLLAAYTTAGGATGKLGWPTDTAYFNHVTGLFKQRFEHGFITWSKATGAKVTIKK